MDSDDEKPAEKQIQLVKALHKEMVDRRIVLTTVKKKKKTKRARNLTATLTLPTSNSSSGSEGGAKISRAKRELRSRSATRDDSYLTTRWNSIGLTASSDSELSMMDEDKKEQSSATSIAAVTKNQLAAARVSSTEIKLQTFSQKLTQRKEKLEELHGKLKVKKENLVEKERKLREFEKSVQEKENLIKTKMAAIKAKDDKLNAELKRLEKLESDLSSKQKLVSQKQAAVQNVSPAPKPASPEIPKQVNNQSAPLKSTPAVVVGKQPQTKPQAQAQTKTTTTSVAAALPKSGSSIVNQNKIQIPAASSKPVSVPLKSISKPKPILQSAERRAKDQNKRISWADSAISSQSPSSNSSDDDVSNLSVRARLKRFENRTML
ncbi:Oidioi.mRNA.OKI2018_I69.chr2.g4525.t2.cds [Oikopleura dioica]|nr:Oidioi.mRNA.OKI2018_I69.chr2.g4525.t2.cds [Oikopleura dioica]